MVKYVNLKEALSYLKSRDSVFIHFIVDAPQPLIDAMVERKEELSNIEIVHFHKEGKAKYLALEYYGIFDWRSFFFGANVRKATQ